MIKETKVYTPPPTKLKVAPENGRSDSNQSRYLLLDVNSFLLNYLAWLLNEIWRVRNAFLNFYTRLVTADLFDQIQDGW